MCYVIATETWPYLFACESLGITFLPVDFCGGTGLEFVLTHSVCLRGCVRLYFFFVILIPVTKLPSALRELKLIFPGLNLFSNKAPTEYSPS